MIVFLWRSSGGCWKRLLKRRAVNREQREAEKQFELKQQKRKEKHRGR